MAKKSIAKNRKKRNRKKWVVSPQAPLCALGEVLRVREVFQPIHDTVSLPQKTVVYRPTDKLVFVVLGMLSGAETVSEIQTKVRPDRGLLGAFGYQRCADASVIQQTLDASTEATVASLEVALGEVRLKQGRRRQVSLASEDEIGVDIDLSSLPIGKHAEGSEKGYVAKKPNTYTRQLARMVCGETQEIFTQRLYPGKTNSDAVFKPMLSKLETVLTLQARQDWLRDYLIDKGQDPIPEIGSASPVEPAIAVADRLHSFLGTRPGWTASHRSWEDTLVAFKEAIEAAGVFLFANGVVGNNTHRSLEGKSFSGFSLIDDYAPFIFLNATEAKSAQMFTLGHELAHLFFGSSAACAFIELQATDHDLEKACDQVAAEYLVPRTALTGEWFDQGSLDETVALLSRRFKVSEIVVARRALDLRLVDREAYSRFFQAYKGRVRRERSTDQDGGNFYYTQNSRLGKEFAKHVVTAVESGEILYRDAYSLTDMYGVTFDNYAGYVAGRGLPS